MRADYSGYTILISISILIICAFSCSGRSGKFENINEESVEETPVVESSAPRLIKMVSPGENSEYKLKDEIEVVLQSYGMGEPPDSVKIYYDGQVVKILRSPPWVYTIPSFFSVTTGKRPIKAIAYRKNRNQTVTCFITLYSDIIPSSSGFKVINIYPHDIEAYTQGLFYYKGLLYEGTGQEAGSSLREIEPETGRILRQSNLDPSLFGEGITYYKDRIYQVTWTSKVGFVYDISTLRIINKIYYPTQGWGLTTYNDMIVMSDGSNILYMYDPELFTLVSQIEVYDNEKAVDQLNELEYINGEIWANIWQTDLIARIDPLTGKVNSYIDLSDLFPVSKRNETNSDVLNGIAFDTEHDRVFVTGKKWPKLYEIKIIE